MHLIPQPLDVILLQLCTFSVMEETKSFALLGPLGL